MNLKKEKVIYKIVKQNSKINNQNYGKKKMN